MAHELCGCNGIKHEGCDGFDIDLHTLATHQSLANERDALVAGLVAFVYPEELAPSSGPDPVLEAIAEKETAVKDVLEGITAYEPCKHLHLSNGADCIGCGAPCSFAV